MVTQMAADYAGVPDVLDKVPEEVRDALLSPDFLGMAQAEFEKLDLDGNGVLSPEELGPLIVQMSNEQPWDVTEEHCVRFAAVFDKNQKGVVSFEEFVECLRFVVIMSVLHAPEQDDRTNDSADMHSLIEQLSADKAALDQVMDQLPVNVVIRLQTEEFMQAAIGEFDALDVDRNGVLSPEELAPVVANLCQRHPWDVTIDHCQRLAVVFDTDQNGVVSREEFADFVKFCSVMAFLEQQMDRPSPVEWVQNVSKQPGFHELCRERFDVCLDIASPEALAGVIQELAGELGAPVKISLQDCVRLVSAFKAPGQIARNDFPDVFTFVLSSAVLEAESMQPGPDDRVHDMLTALAEDKTALERMQDELPKWIQQTFSDPEFIDVCSREFDRLDADSNGYLSPAELVPVIVELSNEHPVNITREHCRRLCDLYDRDGKGVVTRGEYVQLVKFVMVMGWLQEATGSDELPDVPRQAQQPEQAQRQDDGVSGQMTALLDQIGELYSEITAEPHGQVAVAATPAPTNQQGSSSPGGNKTMAQQLRHLQLDHEFYRHKAESLKEERDREAKRARDLESELAAALQRLEAAEQQIRHQELDLMMNNRVHELTMTNMSQSSDSSLEVLKYEIRTKDRALEVAHYDMIRERRAREKLEGKHTKLVDKCKKFGEVVTRQRDYIHTLEKRLNKLSSTAPGPAKLPAVQKSPSMSRSAPMLRPEGRDRGINPI